MVGTRSDPPRLGVITLSSVARFRCAEGVLAGPELTAVQEAAWRYARTPPDQHLGGLAILAYEYLEYR
jgi:hypothetical protein